MRRRRLERRLAAAALILGALAGNARAGDRPSDAEIRAALIGTWIVPQESSDYSELTARAVEDYRPDGTYTGTLFKDAACTTVDMTITVRWAVENGILTSTYPDGRQARDAVLSIGKGHMSLRSLEDGTTYTREQAPRCGQRAL